MSSAMEAGDQRNAPEAEKNQAERFHEGKENAHNADDPKDERSIANRLAREAKREQEGEQQPKEVEELKKDPTLPAKNHGNEPSKGAKIDKELQDEEEAILAKKGSFGPK
ncbi:hypothetical protein B0A48_09789 [Cryoendolithus antarcticus]|uniref:Uncharacterized protein n=1 Tax=Cryoendolithus antarcticus TaxID=1507870 RepID=A0A1V8T2Q3_9PEZI|nr:hypothetical protein B0A48_09789 [Cryoendolithus antarcticus]OQO20948.1 hypothetical protein B0A51_11460 [Rachicladosporium sp. CCFEE 5018]